MNDLVDKLRDIEVENMRKLSNEMKEVKRELKKAQQNEKIQQAYDFDENKSGSIINYTE